MRIAFILPGLHRVRRGAEIAFESIARELAKFSGVEVTLFGSGHAQPNDPYRFIHIGNISREKFEAWPKIKPILRSEYVYEELTFIPGLLKNYKPEEFDFVISCSYPLINWLIASKKKAKQPIHVYVTQNGVAPLLLDIYEWRFFSCDAVVYTNLEYFNAHHQKWPGKIITNGVDPKRFFPCQVYRKDFGLPEDQPVVLMVSALASSKRVLEGIQAVSQLEEMNLVVCGDGPQRQAIQKLGHELMPGRFFHKQLTYEQMPNIYRAADVFLHMSLDEPFGNVYLEALATGLPVVAHDRDVTRWICEDTSVFTNTQCIDSLKSSIRYATKLATADHVSARLGLVNNRYTWKKVGQDYYNFLKSLA